MPRALAVLPGSMVAIASTQAAACAAPAVRVRQRIPPQIHHTNWTAQRNKPHATSAHSNKQCRLLRRAVRHLTQTSLQIQTSGTPSARSRNLWLLVILRVGRGSADASPQPRTHALLPGCHRMQWGLKVLKSRQDTWTHRAVCVCAGFAVCILLVGRQGQLWIG